MVISCAARQLSAGDQETFEKGVKFNLEESLAEQKEREKKNPDTSAVGGTEPSQAAWAFFELCASGKCREALESAAPILRSRLEVPRLEAALGQLRLKNAALFTWKKGKTFFDMATVDGTYTPEPGKVISLLVTLVPDGAAWQVYSTCIRPAGASTPLIPLFAPAIAADAQRVPATPDEKTIRDLVRGDLRFFAGVQESDFFRELYRDSGGRARKREVRGWELLARFRDRDLTPGTALEAPVHFDQAASIGPDGVCHAKVHVGIAQLQLHLNYRFVLTAEGWRVGGKDGQLVPGPQDVERMTRETLLRWDDAIRRGSFVEFHKGISEKWKTEVTPEKFETAFRGFAEKQVVVDGLASAPILISSGPVEDADGLLQFSGRCQTTPMQTVFTLKYWHENGEWRLFGIDVSLPKP